MPKARASEVPTEDVEALAAWILGDPSYEVNIEGLVCALIDERRCDPLTRAVILRAAAQGRKLSAARSMLVVFSRRPDMDDLTEGILDGLREQKPKDVLKALLGLLREPDKKDLRWCWPRGRVLSALGYSRERL